ncbi:MAG TPA: site-specific integrase [Bacteroidia bacterium]|jgi:integrase|nr:site-specific integrase [Bacteroidia bacterium]
MIDLKLIYNRKKEAKKNNEQAVIEIRATLRGARKQKYYSTKIKIALNEWNSEDRKVNAKNKNADEYNFYLKKYVRDLEDLQLERNFKKLPFTFDDIKAYFKHKKEKTSSFFAFVNSELEGDLSLKKKTKTQHRNTLTIFKKFAGSDVVFTQLNISFLERFINYLRAQGYQQNTIHKHHKNLKKYIDLAIKKEFTEIKNPCREVKVRSEQKPRDVLTISQINELAKLCFNENDTKLMQVRDMFLFSCYTGLRISDVCGLKTEYVKSIVHGFELDFFTIKVNKRAELPLYKLFTVPGSRSLPEQILIKYLRPGDIFVFPKLSEAFINRHLKVLAGLCKLNINLTFHIARETFGTYMAGKVEPFYLKNLMQHSDIKTTMRYVHLDKRMMNDKLDKITDWQT